MNTIRTVLNEFNVVGLFTGFRAKLGSSYISDEQV